MLLPAAHYTHVDQSLDAYVPIKQTVFKPSDLPTWAGGAAAVWFSLRGRA